MGSDKDGRRLPPIPDAPVPPLFGAWPAGLRQTGDRPPEKLTRPKFRRFRPPARDDVTFAAEKGGHGLSPIRDHIETNLPEGRSPLAGDAANLPEG